MVGLLTLVICGELLVKELRTTLWSSCGWMIIVLVLLGIAIFLFGNYLVKNSASLFNVEPEPLAKEHIAKEKKEENRAFHERMGMTWYEPEGGIAGFDPKFSWFKADILFLWLAVMTVCFIVEKHSPDNTDYERYEYEYYDDEEPHNYFN